MKNSVRIIVFLIVLSTANNISQYMWVQQNTGTTQNLNKIISCFGSDWLIGENGTLRTFTGSNWSFVGTGYNYNFKDIIFINSQTGYIACSGGKILKTTNTGNSWSLIQTGSTNDINAFNITGQRIIGAGNNGTIFRSTNSGTNWTLINVAATDLSSVLYSYNNYYIVGKNGTCFRSSNLGVNWSMVPISTTQNLNCINHYDSIYAICGDNGSLFRSTNLGSTWTTINTGFNSNFKNLNFSNRNDLYLASSDGKIIHSWSFSQFFIEHTVPVPLSFIDMSLYSTIYGWATGNNGGLFYRYRLNYIPGVTYIDANTIKTPYRNNGSFNRDPMTGNSGFEWPKSANKFARYASGLWLGAQVDNDTLLAIAEYDYEYLPGYTDASGNPHGNNDTDYCVYRLDAGINNYHRFRWPNALLGNSDQGAPVYFDQSTGTWKPLDFGTQTLFTSFTDSYPQSHANRAGSTVPLKADIKLLSYAFAYQGSLNNTIITRYTIINKNTYAWNNLYIAPWSDDDLGNATDDMVACDTNLNLAYTYNADNNDTQYGTAPPAVGFLLLKGPAVYTANNNDTSWLCEANNRKSRIGFKDRKMDIFGWYANAHPVYGDPREYFETYRMIKGLTRNGNVIINPVTNQPTTYMYSGDPVTGQGWVSGPMTSDDQRFISSFGPISMNPGDTQTIVIAQIIARGTSNLNSITVLKQYAQEVRNYYNSCFSGIPIGINPITQNLPDRYELYQNYPNPFNPITKLRFVIPAKAGIHESIRLVVYNSLGQEINTLVNDKLSAGTYEVEWDGRNFASGAYYYSLIVDDNIFATRKMILIK